MRLTYFFAVVVAATLHASGATLIAAKDSNHAAMSNVASADIVNSLDTTEVSGGRMLRKVKKDAAEEEIEEERAGLEAFGKWLKQQGAYLKVSLKKRSPWTYENKLHREFKKGKENAEAVKRHNSAMRAGFE